MILDTCALLWLPSGDKALSDAARQRLAEARTVWYCAISGFELALKVRDGKLELPEEPAAWLKAVARRYGLTEIPLDTELCAAGALLPAHHGDPCDRFIIASALAKDVPVVTADGRFKDYGVETIC